MAGRVNLKLRLKGFFIGGLLLCCTLACQRLPADTENLRQFNGSWVVDVAASLELSPALVAFPERQAYLRSLVMFITMPNRQIIMGQGRQQNREPYNFILLKEDPGKVLIQMEAGDEIIFVKQGSNIIYSKPANPEETLVFRPMFAIDD